MITNESIVLAIVKLAELIDKLEDIPQDAVVHRRFRTRVQQISGILQEDIENAK